MRYGTLEDSKLGMSWFSVVNYKTLQITVLPNLLKIRYYKIDAYLLSLPALSLWLTNRRDQKKTINPI